jgi:hypothetical protein
MAKAVSFSPLIIIIISIAYNYTEAWSLPPSQILKFPSIPYMVGLKFIHTPENLLLLKSPPCTHALFKLAQVQTYEAMKEDYCSIAFQIQPIPKLRMQEDKGTLNIQMFTDKVTESHFIVSTPNNKLNILGAFNIKIEHDNAAGHNLIWHSHLPSSSPTIMSSMYDNNNNTPIAQAWNTQMWHIMAGLLFSTHQHHYFEDMRVCFTPNDSVLSRINNGEKGFLHSSSRVNEDHQLQMYREAVMQKKSL